MTVKLGGADALRTVVAWITLVLLLFSVFSSAFAAEPATGLAAENRTATEEARLEGQDKPQPVGINGRELHLGWILPFAGILLSIALCPLMAPHFWHHHFGKVSWFWALCFIVPFLFQKGIGLTAYELAHTAFLEYIPFIILLFSLFTIAGGVRLTGAFAGTPLVNTAFLFIGTLIASVMGTTGAAMLLIRPVIRANEWRKRKVHVIVFFIFLVANIGGSLTPLGDPPLFLGFLKGVSFFWPTVHMAMPMIFVSGILLAVFFIWDSVLYRKEGPVPDVEGRLGVEGKVNIVLLVCVVGAVLLSGLWKPKVHLPSIAGVHVELQNIVRDLMLLVLAGISWKWTPSISRLANHFSWFPIVEVAKLFAGIFVTIIPAIAILRAGNEGALASLIDLVSKDGQPINSMFFWMTGLLSSFLDNAPTYLVFFNTAGGDAAGLMADVTTLLAISAGAVFFGANTYIGNAPNFMVRSIAEERGIRMPSFFGYMLYSIGILIPIFVLTTWIWFR